MHILMTGASGFIGQHLLRRLVHDGHTVTCVVRERGLDMVRAAGGQALRADLLDPAGLASLPADVEAVMHLVGGGRVSTVGEAGLAGLRRLNVETTRNLLLALPRPPRKLLLFSSVSAQGVRDGEVVREDTPCAPRSPHEIAKHESEIEAETWCARQGVPLAILRPAQVYGPGDERSEIATMLRMLRLGVFPIFGAGNNLMVPMIHVSDVVELAIRALALPFEGTRYFTLTGRQYSVADTIRIFSKVVGRERGWLRFPKGPASAAAAMVESVYGIAGGQPPLSRTRIDNMTAERIYDSTRTVSELGFAPARDLEDGIRETYAWYLAMGMRGLAKDVADYYPIAMAEGEGVGTAYEYLAKWQVIHRILPGVRRMLIAGLPEKYGSSLDFVALACALDVDLVVADEREEALAKLRQAMSRAALSPRVTFHHVPLGDVGAIPHGSSFDLALSCEVLQRLGGVTRESYLRGLAKAARRIAIFAPNAGNSAHASRSRLLSISIEDLRGLIVAAGAPVEDAGFVDMPPFPPGLALSQEKREHVKQAWWQGPALKVLGLYCRAESALSPTVKRPFAHIVYAIATGQAGCTKS
jgi:dihydroflavonol-4-reductase